MDDFGSGGADALGGGIGGLADMFGPSSSGSGWQAETQQQISQPYGGVPTGEVSRGLSDGQGVPDPQQDALNVASFLLDDDSTPASDQETHAAPGGSPTVDHPPPPTTTTTTTTIDEPIPVAPVSAAPPASASITVHDEPLAFTHPPRVPPEMAPVYPGAPGTTLYFRPRPPVRMSGSAMLPRDVGQVVSMHYRQLQSQDPIKEDFYANALRVRRAHRILRAHRSDPRIPPPPEDALRMPLPAAAVMEAASTVQQLLRRAAKRASEWASAHHVLGRHQRKALGAKPQVLLGGASSGAGHDGSVDSGTGSDDAGAQDERAALYAARFAIEHASSVLSALGESQLQRAALMNRHPGPGEAELRNAATAVEAARKGVAHAIGAVRARLPMGRTVSEREEAGTSRAPDGEGDAKLLLLASLPKGKRLLSKAGGQLRPWELCGMVRACFLRLPFVVANVVGGWEAEAADGELVSRLCDWVAGASWPGADGSMGGTGSKTGLFLCTEWVRALSTEADAAVLAELFAHVHGRRAVAALLTRGEAEAARPVSGSGGDSQGTEGGAPGSRSAGPQYVPCPPPSQADVEAWRAVTEAMNAAIAGEM